MSVSRMMKVAAAALSGALLALVVLALASIMNDGKGFVGATAAVGLGWTVPLVSGGIAAALAWSLSRIGETPSATRRTNGAPCPECGGLVRDDWRLCPHCGARL